MHKRVKKPMHTSTQIILGFFSVILIGTLLLMLPISANSGESTSFTISLFTATSATCVTGLVLVDTYQHWTGFGHAVILLLIQIGGLGFMTMATMFSFVLRRKITLKERMIMSSSLSLSSHSGIVRLTREILLGTLIFEGVGAAILATRFYSEFGFWGGIKRGVFHSVSAFCNAGFDLLGHENEFSSLTDYVSDPVINITIMALIIVGGLGFFVWGDLIHRKRLTTHTKLVILTTSILVVGGSVLFFIFERTNPSTIGNMSFSNQALASVFQSVTTRTAGFNTISQADLSNSSLLLTFVLMFIGGSPGSTAGGIKTITIAVLFLAAVSTVRGHDSYIFRERHIKKSVIFNAMSIFFIGLMIISIGAFVLIAIEPFSLRAIMYEVISAFATVGLSTGITASLTLPSQFVIIALMFLGRVGVLTLGFTLFMGNKKKSKVKYPQGVILIG